MVDGECRMPRHSGPLHRVPARGLAILYEDRDILVVDKPCGLLTIGTDREKARTAYFALTDYVRKGAEQSRNRIFIVHRLDRETSGLLVFAKNIEAKRCLQGRWDQTTKRYLAVVHGRCEKRSETISTYLEESSAHRVYSTAVPGKGKLAQTTYTVLKETQDLTLLDVELLTGRKHQIRVHLAERGHPVVGDKRYGRTDTPYRRLALHARFLALRHPVSGRPLTFEARAPAYFTQLVGSFEHLLARPTPAPETGGRRWGVT
jgi:23S rRNA pseudouridine1911/1915/1917 synthase